MNRILTKVLAAFMVMFSFAANAQEVATCGTITHAHAGADITKRLLANKAAFAANPEAVNTEETVFIPVTYHLIAKSDGSNRISLGSVLDMHCKLNEEFAGETNFQFYIKGLVETDNNSMHDDLGELFTNQFLVNQILSIKDPLAMNVYIAQSVNDPQSPGVTLGYYTAAFGLDALFLRKQEVNGFSATFPHEVGHFLSLHHPFYGWDCEYWDSGAHGNPVNLNVGPCETSDGFIPVELANGSNCETAGDFLCDTPASYGQGFGWPDCDYDGGCMDPTGGLIDPMETNMMDYFLNCSEYQFTPNQSEMMMMDYLSPQRGFLRSETYEGISEPVTSVPTLTQGHDAVVYGFQNYAPIAWDAVENADFYYIEISKNITFNPLFGIERRIVYGTYDNLDYLDPNTTYFWRVKGINAVATCGDLSEIGTFTTGAGTTGTTDIEFVNTFNVNPNPVAANATLNLNLSATKAFDAKVNVVNVAGQTVKTIAQQFNQGANTLEISTANLAQGLYIVSVQTADGVMNKRVIVK